MKKHLLQLAISLIAGLIFLMCIPPLFTEASERRFMVLCVPMSQWSWLEETQQINPETGLPEGTGRYERKYGAFWNWIHSEFDPAIITPSFTYLMSEKPKIMLKDAVEWGVEILPVERFAMSGAVYDWWAVGMTTVMAERGIMFIANTVADGQVQEWLATWGFTDPPGGM